jgi:hypothetical protein
MVERVKVFPFRENRCMGNIIWAERDQGSAYYRVSRFAMRGGVFPKDHPVGGRGLGDEYGQCGDGDNINRFRAMGYWASCFPEGDGITWRPLNGQTDAQCLDDIRAAFGWPASWASEYLKDDEL